MPAPKILHYGGASTAPLGSCEPGSVNHAQAHEPLLVQTLLLVPASQSGTLLCSSRKAHKHPNMAEPTMSDVLSEEKGTIIINNIFVVR